MWKSNFVRNWRNSTIIKIALVSDATHGKLISSFASYFDIFKEKLVRNYDGISEQKSFPGISRNRLDNASHLLENEVHLKCPNFAVTFGSTEQHAYWDMRLLCPKSNMHFPARGNQPNVTLGTSWMIDLPLLHNFWIWNKLTLAFKNGGFYNLGNWKIERKLNF